jgi:glycosyltransferase involved in cell wall biosynthesis
MKEQHPLVSIITPSYNKGSYIEETILSVRNQTYKNIEHIIIDGGSTDETLTILKKYENSLIRISEPDKGQSDAINKGWGMAKGQIIAYLNADDTYLPDAVDIAVRYFEQHPEIGMIYGDGILTDQYGKNPRVRRSGPYNFNKLLLCQNNIFQPSVFLKKDVFKKIGDLDVTRHLAMDLDYWIRTGLFFRVAYVPQTLATAKIYGDAKSTAQLFKYVDECEYILDKFFSDPTIPTEFLQLKKGAYNFIYTKGGLDYIHLKMIIEGIKYLFKAIKISPILTLINTYHLLMQFSRKKGSF